jgi:hypothetical protein
MLAELHEQLKQAGASLRLAEVHGAVRDLSAAAELQSRIQGVDQRMGVALLISRWQQESNQARSVA